jgi:hypothetical protein
MITIQHRNTSEKNRDKVCVTGQPATQETGVAKQTQMIPTMIRLREDFRNKLEASAKKSDVSVNQEIIGRLEASYDFDKQINEMQRAHDAELAHVTARFAAMTAQIKALTGQIEAFGGQIEAIVSERDTLRAQLKSLMQPLALLDPVISDLVAMKAAGRISFVLAHEPAWKTSSEARRAMAEKIANIINDIINEEAKDERQS